MIFASVKSKLLNGAARLAMLKKATAEVVLSLKRNLRIPTKADTDSENNREGLSPKH
jgi:hypothetical protein